MQHTWTNFTEMFIGSTWRYCLLVRSALETQNHNSVAKTPIFLEFLGQILRLILKNIPISLYFLNNSFGDWNSINEKETTDLKMEAVSSCETLVSRCPTTRRRNRQDLLSQYGTHRIAFSLCLFLSFTSKRVDLQVFSFNTES